MIKTQHRTLHELFFTSPSVHSGPFLKPLWALCLCVESVLQDYLRNGMLDRM